MRLNKIVSVSVASILVSTFVPFSECVRTDLAVYAEDAADVGSDTLNLGDINSDGLVDAVDASLILAEYARLSTGSDYSFSENQIAAADANSDGLIDAVDSSLVLAYYAYLSTGGTITFENFLKLSNSSDTGDIYSTYLSQQKLCKISKNFKILEAGTVRDNPNGLAGAVKHDFDGDEVDELVTFTFDKNSTDGEDIRVDLLKVSGNELIVTDSRYLTEMLEINDAEGSVVSDTIFFSKDISMEIVTSEYNDTLYFGSLLSYDGYVGAPGATEPYLKSMNVFTVEDDSIIPCTIAGTYMKYSTIQKSEYEGVLYSTLLPPTIRDISEFSECKVAEDKLPEFNYDYAYKRSSEIINEINSFIKDNNAYMLFADVNSPFTTEYYVEGGVYDSGASAYSALLNEFGLDIKFNNLIEHDNYECSSRFVSENQSTTKTILEIDAVRGYTKGSVLSSDDNLFMGSRLTLKSDLEILLNNDNLFTEPLADELALYEDILRYPYYYHEVWDKYISKSDYKIRYFVADIDADNQYELVIGSYITSPDINSELTIVKPSSEGLDIFDGDAGSISFYNNGIVLIDYMSNGGYESKSYYDAPNNIYWLAWNTKESSGGYTEYTRHISIKDSNYELIGDEAIAKEAELLSGTKLIPEFNSYDIYSPEDFKEFVFIDDINEITYTWQKAYINQIEEKSTKADMEYSLIYIDNDDIPELIIGDPVDSRKGGVYTYHNDSSVELTYLTLRCNMDGYVEKGGIFGVYWWWLEKEGYYIYEIENGAVNQTDAFLITHTADGNVYTINDTEVTESVYNETYALCSSEFTKVTYCTYDEIIEKLNVDVSSTDK